MNPWLQRWLRVRDHLSDDLLGGPKVLRFSWVINVQKGGTLAFVLALMAAYDVWTPAAWTYAALHGSYGLCWLLKEAVFPDPNWQRPITIGGALASWTFVLGPYWLAPWLLIRAGGEAPPWLLGVCGLFYTLGVVLMMGSDAQKYFVLRERPGLITDGFFARVRHPNYLGEMLLYGSFAALSQHVVPWLVLAAVWSLVFVPNMLQKEARMARHPGWTAYRARTGLLWPW
jgi:protein-S-isoprenylcysteine O-methyltransferase Ste14